jgi:DNA-directed RNA polymerase subunit N (RpoN/RPB10)
MDIKSKVPLKCSSCGGAKYIDDPFLIHDTWFVDVVCLSCGHSKDIEVERLREVLSSLEKASKNVN